MAKDLSLQSRHIGSDGIRELMEKLPHNIQAACMAVHETEQIEEILMDLGRPLWIVTSKSGPRMIPEIVIEDRDIDNYLNSTGSVIKSDNRTGIEGTLHRLSVIRARDSQKIIGVATRFGLPVFEVAEGLRPELELVSGMMVIGPPAKGKTTLLRDMVRICSTLTDPDNGFVIGPRILVVDTSGDIGGHGNVTHPILGAARRVPVPDPDKQTELILQVIGNQSPKMIVVDEIRNEGEARALSMCTKRGVQAIATCHGEQLIETVENPTFWPVLGDIAIDPVTLKRRRFSKPVFGTAVEVWHKGLYVVHKDLAHSIDRVLAGKLPDVHLVGDWSKEQIVRMADAVEGRLAQTRGSLQEEAE